MGSNRAPLLQAVSSRFRRAELTPAGTLSPWPSLRLGDRIDGHYDVVDGVTWMLYRDARGIVLRVGEQAFVLDGTRDLAWSGAGAARRLEVRERATTLASFACPAPAIDRARIDATPFAEDEDFDLPRMAYALAHDEGRRARAYR